MHDVVRPVGTGADGREPRYPDADELIERHGFTGADGFWYPCDLFGAGRPVPGEDDGARVRRGLPHHRP